jgi:hypothetical protein
MGLLTTLLFREVQREERKAIKRGTLSIEDRKTAVMVHICPVGQGRVTLLQSAMYELHRRR